MGAAVLVPIIQTFAGDMILFEVRSDNVPQPGEICFPGGRIEAGETAVQAAIRETFEELGIRRDQITIVRELERDITITGKTIQPILAYIDESALSNIEMSDGEVKGCFLAPVRWFQKTPEREFSPGDEVPEVLGKYLKNYPDFTIPTYYWEYNGYGIWGLTARMLRRLIRENK